MNKTKLIVPGQDDYFVQEAFKVLRTNIQFCGKDVKVIAITSCDMSEGKTTVAIQLGISLAELGKQVLIVDADMRKSVMAGRNTTASAPKGLSELLTGMCPLADVMYGTQYEDLDLIFCGSYPPNPVELLGSKYFGILLEKTKEYYDYIIIDTPPLGLVVDAAVAATQCDSAILVMGKEVTRRAKAVEVVGQLRKSGCNVLGVVWNNNSGKKDKYYYYKKKYK